MFTPRSETRAHIEVRKANRQLGINTGSRKGNGANKRGNPYRSVSLLTENAVTFANAGYGVVNPAIQDIEDISLIDASSGYGKKSSISINLNEILQALLSKKNPAITAERYFWGDSLKQLTDLLKQAQNKFEDNSLQLQNDLRPFLHEIYIRRKLSEQLEHQRRGGGSAYDTVVLENSENLIRMTHRDFVFFNRDYNYSNYAATQLSTQRSYYPATDYTPVLEAVFLQKEEENATGIKIPIFECSMHGTPKLREYSDDDIVKLWSDMCGDYIESALKNLSGAALKEKAKQLLKLKDENLKTNSMYRTQEPLPPHTKCLGAADSNYSPELKARVSAAINVKRMEVVLNCYRPVLDQFRTLRKLKKEGKSSNEIRVALYQEYGTLNTNIEKLLKNNTLSILGFEPAILIDMCEFPELKKEIAELLLEESVETEELYSHKYFQFEIEDMFTKKASYQNPHYGKEGLYGIYLLAQHLRCDEVYKKLQNTIADRLSKQAEMLTESFSQRCPAILQPRSAEDTARKNQSTHDLPDLRDILQLLYNTSLFEISDQKPIKQALTAFLELLKELDFNILADDKHFESSIEYFAYIRQLLWKMGSLNLNPEICALWQNISDILSKKILQLAQQDAGNSRLFAFYVVLSKNNESILPRAEVKNTILEHINKYGLQLPSERFSSEGSAFHLQAALMLSDPDICVAAIRTSVGRESQMVNNSVYTRPTSRCECSLASLSKATIFETYVA